MASLTPIRYTVRREKGGQFKGEDTLLLLDSPASYGHCGVWDTIGGHSEGSLRWYRSTIKTPREDAESLALRYLEAYYSPQEREGIRLVYCYRVPHTVWTQRRAY